MIQGGRVPKTIPKINQGGGGGLLLKTLLKQLSGDPQMDDSEGGVPPAARQGPFESLYKDFERPSKNM
jgi:hypothetical protein